MQLANKINKDIAIPQSIMTGPDSMAKLYSTLARTPVARQQNGTTGNCRVLKINDPIRENHKLMPLGTAF